jgi:hypothetical protein
MVSLDAGCVSLGICSPTVRVSYDNYSYAHKSFKGSDHTPAEYAREVCEETTIVDIVGGLHFLKPGPARVNETRKYLKRLPLLLRINRDHMHGGCLECGINTTPRFEMEVAAALPGKERHEREPRIENNPDRAP